MNPTDITVKRAGMIRHSIVLMSFIFGFHVYANTAKFSPTDLTPWGILAIKAPQAWALSGKGAGARILILDSGVDSTHPALKANIEKTKDFLSIERNIVPSTDDSVAGGHGTFIAGIIAGSDTNGFTGVAPEAKILVGRVCSDEIGGCDTHANVYGIDWGIEEKVDVISLSQGYTDITRDEEEAIQRALAAGITIVAASGNSGVGTVEFPGATPGVIAVGAVDSKIQKWSKSNWGPELSVVAPGLNIISSAPRKAGVASADYSANTGTSFSVPFVSGIVALMKAANKNLTPGQVRTILQDTADHLVSIVEDAPNEFSIIGEDGNNKFGSGLVDAEAAVKAAIQLKLNNKTNNSKESKQ